MKIYIYVISFVVVAYGSIFLSDERIAGGLLAEEGQFPYVVSIVRNNRHSCGGAILSQRWILTAAHCIKDHDPSSMSILAGTVRRSVNGTLYNVSFTIKHDPIWDADNFTNDIGLLRLPSDIIFTDLIQPISLNPSHIPPGRDLILAGWGRMDDDGQSVDDLNWIALKTISQEDCQERLSHMVREYMMCTFTKEGEGSCKGDSGSPLVVDGGVGGIVSWGRQCGRGYPNVATRVASFFDWIEKTMKENEES